MGNVLGNCKCGEDGLDANPAVLRRYPPNVFRLDVASREEEAETEETKLRLSPFDGTPLPPGGQTPSKLRRRVILTRDSGVQTEEDRKSVMESTIKEDEVHLFESDDQMEASMNSVLSTASKITIISEVSEDQDRADEVAREVDESAETSDVAVSTIEVKSDIVNALDSLKPELDSSIDEESPSPLKSPSSVDDEAPSPLKSAISQESEEDGVSVISVTNSERSEPSTKGSGKWSLRRSSSKMSIKGVVKRLSFGGKKKKKDESRSERSSTDFSALDNQLVLN